MAMLASITNVFTARHVPPEGGPRTASVSGRQLPQIGGQFSEGRLSFIDKGLAKDFPMLGLG